MSNFVEYNLDNQIMSWFFICCSLQEMPTMQIKPMTSKCERASYSLDFLD